MTILMMTFFNYIKVIHQKGEISQLARKYILRMETVGYLTGQDAVELKSEMDRIGATNINLEGSTLSAVGYGESIVLDIKGVLQNEFAFEEKRTSTAKN